MPGYLGAHGGGEPNGCRTSRSSFYVQEDYTLEMDDQKFRTRILRHWRRQGRHTLPWRKTTNPYRILVSEIMLQQTQVDRVIPYYRRFLKAFPTFRALAGAPVGQLLIHWQGLGYNRRALMLQRCAQTVTTEYRGKLPDDYEKLQNLPGIGPYTAGAVMAFAFNKSQTVIETNIRRVYLHHYFADQSGIGDAELLPIVERTLDRRNPRQWYAALMDYGATLKGQVPNPNRRSKHYTKQSKFEGSRRQLRGAVLRAALQGENLQPTALARRLGKPVSQIRLVLAVLSQEGLLAV